MSNEQLEHFELPRSDWRDNDGRINKTALIDDFNAIEEKINELINLPPIGWAGIDFDTFDYDNTTLASDDNRIVNLKSLIDIMNLKGVILNCSFNGKKLNILQYYNDNYRLVTITDATLTGLGTDGKNFVYLDYAENIVYLSDDEDNTNGDVLVAIYSPSNDTVWELNDKYYIDCNVLEVLSRMEMKIRQFDSIAQIYSKAGVQNGKGYRAAAYSSKAKKRTIGLVTRESRGAEIKPLILRDLGV